MRDLSPPALKYGSRTANVSADQPRPNAARPTPQRRAPTSTSTTPNAATVSPRSSFTSTRGATQATATLQRLARNASSANASNGHGQGHSMHVERHRGLDAV